MNIPETAAVTNIILHNPSSCTCGRIIWLTLHCDFFVMTLGTSELDAHIEARIGATSQSMTFRPEILKDVVSAIFWPMWDQWQPTEGIKVTPDR